MEGDKGEKAMRARRQDERESHTGEEGHASGTEDKKGKLEGNVV